jgi:putative heme-binding domain-containing protein
MAGGKENYEACVRLLALAPRSEDRTLVVEGMAAAFEGGKIPELPRELSAALNAHLSGKLDTDLALAVKTGSAEAAKKALAIIRDDKAPVANRVALVQAFADSGNREVVPVILQLFSRGGNVAVRLGVLPLAAKFDDVALPTAVIKGYEARFSQTATLKDATHRMLASRHEWAKLFLAEIDQWQIRAQDVAPDIVRQLELYRDPELERLIRKHWPTGAAKLSNQEKVAVMNQMKAVLAAGDGDVAKGKTHFTQRCAACHTLFDEGGQIGPNLTGYERSNVDFWLVATLDPNAEIREGFGAYTARLKDGQTLMGMLVQQDANSVVLKDMAGQKHTARINQIESLEAFPQSLMPEGLLSGLDDAALRDLFAYLKKP